MYSAEATGTVGTVTIDPYVTLTVMTPTYNLPSGGLTLDNYASIGLNTGTAETINGSITLAGNGVGIRIGHGSLTVSGAITGGYGVFNLRRRDLYRHQHLHRSDNRRQRHPRGGRLDRR